ncbi:MAG: DUF1194 domain-containing protein [Bauldia sp.]|nr:DUF1194 domain-containing protein [Bauldia sp.]
MLAGLLLAAVPARAQAPVDVDLELVLAVDVSGSMDRGEADLQRQGYVAAFRHPDVIRAIESGLHGKIAVSYVEWAGPQYQNVAVPWSIVSDAGSAGRFADAIARLPFHRDFGTSISSVLLYAAERFAESGARGFRRTIDISGDGPNNMGLPVDHSRDTVVGEGIAINGLPVMIHGGAGRARMANLDVYYEDCVIGGPGAFIVPVHDRDGFADAIRRKLVLEIAGLPPRVMRAAETQRSTRIDCLIGEKTRGNWMLSDP